MGGGGLCTLAGLLSVEVLMKRQSGVEARWGRFSVLFVGLALLALLLVQEAGAVHRGTLGLSDTPVGTVIGNVATAEYTDANGVTQNAQSNIVETTVAQVFDVNLEAGATKLSPIGVQVSFPHTVTNTGNGPDSYTLTAAENTLNGGAFNFSNIEIYADATCDGIPDNATNLNGAATPVLAPGDTYCFIVVANVPATAIDNDTEDMTVTATSVNSGAATDSNTDVVIVTTDAVINVSKSLDIAQGEEGQIFTYTISYTNSGNGTATLVTITDMVPTGLEYVDASGRWSGTGATVLTDAVDAAQGTPPVTVTYSAAPLTGATLVTAVISEVGPGASGFITFQVQVLSTITTAPTTIFNGGSGADGLGVGGVADDPGEVGVSYNDGSATQTTTTNSVPFDVLLTSAVTGTGDTEISKPQGSVFTFENSFTNGGSGPDTFNVTLGTDTFPAGTGFTLQNSSGSPLLDTNGDGIVDTGVVAAGASVTVLVQVTLPPGATDTGLDYTLSKTATSTGDPISADPSQTVTDILQSIANAVVDLTNSGTVLGNGSTGATVITELSTNPGGSVAFDLRVNNEGPSPDAYAITSSALPAGWTVSFFDVFVNVTTCGGTGVVATNVIPAAGFQQICALVTVPAQQVPGTTNITFTVASPTSGATDSKVDAVKVNEVREIQLISNQGSSISPGAVVSYVHTLSNNGNITETNINITTADSLTANGWTSLVYLDGDSNGDGIVDALPDGDPSNDTLIASGSVVLVPIDVAAYSSVFLIVQVSAPFSAAPPDVDTTDITATATLVSVAPIPPAVSNTDTSTVTAGTVTLKKQQVLDVGCNGGETAFTSLPILSGAVPDACILYKIVATNAGNLPVTGLTVTDTVLVNTSYETSCGVAATTSGSITAPADEATSGTIVATIGTLNASATATVTFCLQID